ncbi:MAG: hypothetical protein V4819_23430 [Verrucomicrobiota bacterium]
MRIFVGFGYNERDERHGLSNLSLQVTSEKVFDPESCRIYRWFQTGLQPARLVARMGRNAGQGHGAGFLLKGSELTPRYGDDLVLLTNAHAISNDEVIRKTHGALPSQEVVTTFEAHGPDEYRVTQRFWRSPPDALDAIILRLTNADFPATKVAANHAALVENLPPLMKPLASMSSATPRAARRPSRFRTIFCSITKSHAFITGQLWRAAVPAALFSMLSGNSSVCIMQVVKS